MNAESGTVTNPCSDGTPGGSPAPTEVVADCPDLQAKRRVSYYDDSGGYYDATGGYFVDTPAELSEPDRYGTGPACPMSSTRRVADYVGRDEKASGSESSDIELCRELLHYRRLYSGEWDVRVNQALERLIERAQ